MRFVFRITIENMATGSIELAETVESIVVATSDSQCNSKSSTYIDGATLEQAACTITTAIEQINSLCQKWPEVGKLVDDYFDGVLEHERTYLS